MSKTTIEWVRNTDGSSGKTWNPVRGCSPVSPGCKNCYAERQGGRFAGPGRPFDGFIQLGKNGNPGPHWTGKVELIEHMLTVPLRTRKPTTWFVNSMSDLFHEELPDEVIDRVFAVMAQAKQHTFQVLTKRADRMLHVMTKVIRTQKFWPLPNVWLGVSVEDQQRADERIQDLLQTPAAVRFLSVEPMLGRVDLKLSQWVSDADERRDLLGWVIVGGESGPGARAFDIAWARSIVRQCSDAGVPCFVKQLGSVPVQPVGGIDPRHTIAYPTVPMKLKNRKGGDMEEWPKDLRVRQMPEPR